MKVLLIIIAIVGVVYLALHLRSEKILELPINSQPITTSTVEVPTLPATTTPISTVATTTPANITISVAEAIAAAPQYNYKNICVQGYYETTFEFSALADKYHLDDKQYKQIDKPYIWVGASVPRSQLQCAESGQGLYCFGQVTICGLFEVAASGASGFGQLGLYQYQLRQQ